MADFQLVMPKMGESIMEATILKWYKQKGEVVEVDETILEIATDKVDSEIPSPVSGTIKEVFFEVDQIVPIGAAIAVIETGVEVDMADDITSQPIVESRIEPTETFQNGSSSTQVLSPRKLPPVSNGRFYSPLVRMIAQEEGLSLEKLDTVHGTGLNGRVTKKDILSFLDRKEPAQEVFAVPEEQPRQKVLEDVVANDRTRAKSVSGGEEIVQMDRMRKMIAEHMISSKKTAAHVTSFVEADVTDMVKWREKNKDLFLTQHGTKLTYTPIFIQSVSKAIFDFPMINSSLNGDEITIKKDVNIGMATALPSGNLIVPVIKGADNYNLTGLAKQVNTLADRARKGELSPDEVSGGTFTVTNMGAFGNLMGTPIINQPQVAILATGAIQKKPAVVETEYGDLIAVRHMMFLSMSYDHRIIDGFLGGSFLRRVADYLEQFGREDVI